MWAQLLGISPAPISPFSLPSAAQIFVHLSYSISKQFIIARLYDFPGILLFLFFLTEIVFIIKYTDKIMFISQC